MKYELIKSKKDDIARLIEYKKKTIFEYAHDLDEKEIKKINDYINKNVPIEIGNYFNIIVDDKIVGCLLLTSKDDGILIDELYIEEDYRNHGIGSEIIKNILNNNNIVYLWVYKLNKKAISLYQRLGFSSVLETETRIFMKYVKNLGDNYKTV